MYALIYDDHDSNKPQKRVISVHASRKNSEMALFQRQKDLGKRVWECNTRIVWTDKAVEENDILKTCEFVTWNPSEKIPEGELNSDVD